MSSSKSTKDEGERVNRILILRGWGRGALAQKVWVFFHWRLGIFHQFYYENSILAKKTQVVT